MSRTAAKILLAVVMGFSLGACHDTAASTGPDAAVGVYTLQTIDGQPLPAIVDQVGNDIAEVTQGSVTLDGDMTFDDVTVLRITQAGVVSNETQAAAGTWTLSGRTLELNPSDGSGVYELTWDGNDELTQTFQGFTLVYRR
jgi:hypothetical protein